MAGRNFDFNAELLCKSRMQSAESIDMPTNWKLRMQASVSQRKNFQWRGRFYGYSIGTGTYLPVNPPNTSTKNILGGFTSP